jgi:peptide/nickel transport system substrate-binding protein
VRPRRAARSIVAGIWLAATIAACGPAPARLGADDTVTIAIPQEPEHLFAPGATSVEAHTVLGALTEGLVVENEAGELEPRLATRVPSLENGDAVIARTADGRGALTVRFELREGARWHDGAPVRPADLRFGWLLHGNRDAPIAYRGVSSLIQDVRAIDEHIVEVVYRSGERDPQYALCCNGFVLPEAHLRDVPIAKLRESAFARAPVYAGPYLMSEHSRASITLERSPHYLVEPPKLRRVMFVYAPDPDVALSDLTARRVDVATAGLFGADRAAELQTIERRGIRVVYTPSLALEHLDFNLRDPTDLAKPHPILSDRAVRAAIAAAIDRGAIAREASAGRLSSASSYLVPPSWAAARASEVTSYPYDRAAAERALEQAGWRRAEDGVRAKDGTRMRLRLVVASGNRVRDRASLKVVDDLGRVGIEVALDPIPTSRLTAGPPSGPLASGSFDLALYSWVGNRDPAGWSLAYHRAQVPTATNGYAGQNYPGWIDDRFSALAEEAGNSLERETRRGRYLEMQRIWTEALPALPLYQRVQVDVADARVLEIRPLPTRQPLTWNIARWSLGGV